MEPGEVAEELGDLPRSDVVGGDVVGGDVVGGDVVGGDVVGGDVVGGDVVGGDVVGGDVVGGVGGGDERCGVADGPVRDDRDDLGIDARRTLSDKTIATIAAWRTPSTAATTRAVARTEAIRLARRVRALDDDLAANRIALTSAVTTQAPELLQVRGVGPVVAATVLHAWSHHGRVHSEAAFAALAGAAPLPASSGNTRRHRLNRGGDRRLNRAPYTVAITRLGHDPRTRAYLARRTAEGCTRREIIRVLKRYISRELFRLLTATQPRSIAI